MKTKIAYLFLMISAFSSIGEVYAQSHSWVGGFYKKIGVQKIVISPNGNIYAGTFGWGIFRSTNGGLDWNQSNEGIPKDLISLWVPDIAIDTNNRIYAATFGAGVYRSIDDGLHWNPINNGLTNMYANCIAIAPNGYLFVGTNAALFRSSDSGDHWSMVNQGFPDGVGSFNSMIAAHNGNIFASCAYSVDNLVYRSTDNGESWSSITNGISGWPTACFVVDVNGDLYAGSGAVYRSTNNGSTWTGLTSGPHGVVIYSLAIDSSHAILASTGHGIFRTTDHGNQWNSYGLSTTEIRSMAVRPDGEILAGPEYLRGIFLSSNSGATWEYNSMGYFDKWSQTYSLAIRAPNIFTGTAAGVLCSTDEGVSWNSVGLLQDTILSLALDSTGRVFAAAHSGNVYASTNNGSNWNTGIGLPNDPVLSIASDSSENLFAGTAAQSVFCSTDHGSQWFSAGYGLSSSSILSLTADQKGFVFAGTADSGVFRSSNKGISWSPVNSGLTNLHVAVIVADNLSLQGPITPLYIGTDHGVFRSTDNGNTWNSLCLNSLSISSLLAMRDTVLIGTNGYGTYRFPDTSTKWYGIPNSKITALGDIRCVHYFAATIDMGIYQINDVTAPLLVNVENKESLPVSFALNQNFPNPFNPATIITFLLPHSGHTTLQIFNLIGQEIAIIVNESLSAGKHSVSWNAQKFPSGVYFYRLQSGSFSQTKKLVLLK